MLVVPPDDAEIADFVPAWPRIIGWTVPSLKDTVFSPEQGRHGQRSSWVS
jgi:hypothetical protein